jgi:hypothetical protein
MDGNLGFYHKIGIPNLIWNAFLFVHSTTFVLNWLTFSIYSNYYHLIGVTDNLLVSIFMTVIARCVGLLLLVLASNIVLAQAVIKEKKSLSYTLTSTDSIVRAQKSSTYNKEGALLNCKHYYYNLSAPGVLVKEESANFDTDQQILTETITRYPKDKEPQTERLETKYLVYAAKEKDSKRIWRRHFDRFGELTKEDTLTYNDEQLLLNNCQYNYMGSTSLLCDEYQYKDGLKKRWLMYSKWNTIDAKSQVVEKQTKRRDYRYFYNRAGQLKRVRAKDYASKICRKVYYDQEGRLSKNYILVRRKVSKPVDKAKGDKSDKKRKYIQKTEEILLYDAGKLLSAQRLVDGKETNSTIYEYEDSLLQKETIRVNSTKTEEILYSYQAGVLTEKISHKLDQKGNIRYSIKNFYNEQGQAVRKEQIAGKNVLSVVEWTYNKHGDILSRISYRPKQKRPKKGMEEMEPSKEKIVYIYSYH